MPGRKDNTYGTVINITLGIPLLFTRIKTRCTSEMVSR